MTFQYLEKKFDYIKRLYDNIKRKNEINNNRNNIIIEFEKNYFKDIKENMYDEFKLILKDKLESVKRNFCFKKMD